MTENKTNLDRVETGPIQFEDDWPGVFIRGDNAAGFSMSLSNMLEKYKKTDPKDRIDIARIEGLINVLRSSLFNNMDSEKIVTETRVVKRNK